MHGVLIPGGPIPAASVIAGWERGPADGGRAEYRRGPLRIVDADRCWRVTTGGVLIGDASTLRDAVGLAERAAGAGLVMARLITEREDRHDRKSD